jgi:hypothetical protein
MRRYSIKLEHSESTRETDRQSAPDSVTRFLENKEAIVEGTPSREVQELQGSRFYHR